jgi:hypothetical protein
MGRVMKTATFLAAAIGVLASAPAGALTLVRPSPDIASPAMTQVQYSNSAGFRSCMRGKYGSHYFRGVKRAHRYHMAQACGG